MTKFFIILDLVLGVLCSVRHEVKTKNVGISQVTETIVINESGDTLSVDTVRYENNIPE